MKSMTPIVLMSVIAFMAYTSQGFPNPEGISSEMRRTDIVDIPTLQQHPLNKRYADAQQPTIIESNEPTDKILKRFSTSEEEAELVDDNYQAQEQRDRQKRAARAILIRVCNKRTRVCKNILIVRRN